MNGPIVLVLIAVLLAGCQAKDRARAASSGEAEVTELRYLGGFGNVSFPELAEDLGYLSPVHLIWKGNVLGGPASIQAVASGDVDFGTAATGSNVKLQAVGAHIVQVITSGGIDASTWGGAYVLANSPILSARDLIGKKISVNTLGAHSEFMIREWLGRGGLSKDDIKQVTLIVIPSVNAEQTLRNGTVDAAMFSGILRDRALERGGIRRLFSDRELFGDFHAATYVVTSKFARERPNTLRRFVEATARAIEWARTTPREEVRTRLHKILSMRARGEDPEFAEHWQSVGIHSPGGLISDGDIQLWIDWLTKQGDLPKGVSINVSSLYTNEFNPFRDHAKATVSL